MAKFLKSIFQSPSQEKERRKSARHDGETEGDGESPISDRRKLSMSRSGRLKQSYKKRHSLSLELYGNEDNLKTPEKPKSREYHVNNPVTSPPTDQRRKSIEGSAHSRTQNANCKSPEEEIDNAFEIIDKT